MMRHLLTMFSIVAALGAYPVIAHANTPRYLLTILADPKHLFTLEARAINDAGVVVGVSVMRTPTGSNPQWHAFLYRDGKYNEVGILPGYEYSEAVAINNHNEIIGTCSAIGRPEAAFLWRDGRQTRLEPVEGGACDVYAINDDGDVAGSATLPDGNVVAAVWHCRGASLATAPTLYTKYDRAVALSDGGDVVAVSGSQSYILKDGREMRVGTLGGTDGVCTAMDDLGDVVGVSTTRTELTHAFLWQRGQIIDVSTIKSLDGTTPVLATQSINDVGQIVGAVRNGTDTRAMIFENGHASNLNHLIPWGIIILDLARAINNRGQIIGQGHMNATYVSYLLTPIVPANPPAVHPVSAFDVTPPGYRPQGPPPGTLARPVGAAGA